ncbi:MAG: hypothetical protein J7598_17960 [Mitsuaria chitosanitabida]|uniref:hypothetical protein n=1 Tax=Roseateles chitosanitabidus TaxID=65048 RepID=UPI001B1CE37E|nr:hypothetical protein [Roseateles chitosanitabidus]MBO9688495.1 hypothetical protein [Roseateles chitosanitabidus]
MVAACACACAGTSASTGAGTDAGAGADYAPCAGPAASAAARAFARVTGPGVLTAFGAGLRPAATGCAGIDRRRGRTRIRPDTEGAASGTAAAAREQQPEGRCSAQRRAHPSTAGRRRGRRRGGWIVEGFRVDRRARTAEGIFKGDRVRQAGPFARQVLHRIRQRIRHRIRAREKHRLGHRRRDAIAQRHRPCVHRRRADRAGVHRESGTSHVENSS